MRLLDRIEVALNRSQTRKISKKCPKTSGWPPPVEWIRIQTSMRSMRLVVILSQRKLTCRWTEETLTGKHALITDALSSPTRFFLETPNPNVFPIFQNLNFEGSLSSYAYSEPYGGADKWLLYKSIIICFSLGKKKARLFCLFGNFLNALRMFFDIFKNVLINIIQAVKNLTTI